MTEKPNFNIQIGSGKSVTYTDVKDSQKMNCVAKRNYYLADSDCYMLEDYPTTKKTEWKEYRQKLRDMDFSDLDNLTWPTKPE